MPLREANVVYPAGDRQDFSIIYHELWDCYLPYLGPAATLMYCFLQHRLQHGLAGPSSPTWAAEICAPLGLSVTDSHQAWARLQEMGLIVANSDGSYSLLHPKSQAEFKETFTDLAPRQQQLPQLGLEARIELDASQRAQRRQRAQTSLYSLVEQQFGRILSPTEAERLQAYEATYPRELVELAVEVAVIAQALSMAYIEQVLLNWQVKGIKTAQAARADAEQFRLQKAMRGSGRKTAKSGGKASETQDDLDLYRLPPTDKPKEDA